MPLIHPAQQVSCSSSLGDHKTHQIGQLIYWKGPQRSKMALQERKKKKKKYNWEILWSSLKTWRGDESYASIVASWSVMTAALLMHAIKTATYILATAQQLQFKCNFHVYLLYQSKVAHFGKRWVRITDALLTPLLGGGVGIDVQDGNRLVLSSCSTTRGRKGYTLPLGTLNPHLMIIKGVEPVIYNFPLCWPWAL